MELQHREKLEVRSFGINSKDGFEIVYELKDGRQNLNQRQLCLCLEHKQMTNFIQQLDTRTSQSFLKKFSFIGRGIARVLILFYQATLAHFLGGRCRYYPSCSHYALEAYEKFSFLTATKLTLKRLSKCHPLSQKPFYDPVPNSPKEMSLS